MRLPAKQEDVGSNPTCDSNFLKLYRGVEEFGRPRWSHKPEIVGSNPTPATI